MDDVGAVLFDVTVACAIVHCALVITVILDRRREAKSDRPGADRKRH